MPNTGAERRRHTRVYFNDGEAVTAVIGPFEPAGGTIQSLEARVLNLSLGGLYATAGRDAALRFRAGETVIMYELRANDLWITSNIMLEIRRVEDQPIFNNIGYGCQFVGLDQSSRERLDRFLAWQLGRLRSMA